jgi:hypothetical protein
LVVEAVAHKSWKVDLSREMQWTALVVRKLSSRHCLKRIDTALEVFGLDRKYELVRLRQRRYKLEHTQLLEKPRRGHTRCSLEQNTKRLVARGARLLEASYNKAPQTGQKGRHHQQKHILYMGKVQAGAKFDQKSRSIPSYKIIETVFQIEK